MKAQTKHNKITGVMSKIAKQAAMKDAKQACGFILYQPKAPKSLLEMDKTIENLRG